MISESESIARALEVDGDYRVLRRYRQPDLYFEPLGRERIGIIVDTETTGLDPRSDEIVEFAMVKFAYDTRDRPTRILGVYNWLQEPSAPLSYEVQQVTGLTDEILTGHAINHDDAWRVTVGASIVIAHKAGFDRRFVERSLPVFRSLGWACSLEDIDWRSLGAPSASLETLAWWKGFFYEAHRASTDCLALLHLLAQDHDGEPLLSHLLAAARLPRARLWADAAPFEIKDELKARGYRWHDGAFGHRKAWFLDCPLEELPRHQTALQLLAGTNGQPVLLRPSDRYSERAFA